ncbi:tripartite tricarboxylate transporter substrate binding protein [Orrella sp. JC864]|uniref:Bug family tripartite tricarboxylate transporter substrate binding protein n=1 Tax=Orrella sp. JC864 TaxID=3120298 RepID=UPI0012BD709E
MNPMLRRCLCALLLAAGAAAPLAGHAQAYPSRPVTLIVPQTPGGSSDRLARMIAAELGERWKQPVVVENRSGAGGNIGMAAFAKTPPDGHAMLLSYVGTHAVNPSLYKDLAFDVQKDFVAAATLASVPFVLAVNSKVPVQDFAGFVQYAKAQPNLTYGSAGTGSLNHLLGEMLNQVTGVKLMHVPYRGAAEAMTDMIGGQITAVFASLPSIAGLIREGTVKALAVTSARRAAQFSDIPTIAESGYPDYVVDPWFGLFLRAGTPQAIVAQVNADTNAILRDPGFVQKLATLGAEPMIMSPEQFAEQADKDLQTWSQVVASTGASRD